MSLAFTSYQTGRLYLVDDNKRGSFHERFLARAMGLWADPQRLVVSTLFQLWRGRRARRGLNNALASELRESKGRQVLRGRHGGEAKSVSESCQSKEAGLLRPGGLDQEEFGGAKLND